MVPLDFAVRRSYRKNPRVGDRVAYANQPGTYAEMAILPADRVVALPAAVSFEQGPQ